MDCYSQRLDVGSDHKQEVSNNKKRRSRDDLRLYLRGTNLCMYLRYIHNETQFFSNE
jgi:hypothetical protein